MRVRQADWAAQVPWAGIQDLPEFLRGPDGNITIGDVQGLQAALDALAGGGGGGPVTWNSITGKPSFGSAAYVPVSAFVPAPTAQTLQLGVVPFVMGEDRYAVAFTETMKAVPNTPQLQVVMTDGTGETLFAVVDGDTLDADGFTFQLNAPPALSTGYCAYRAVVESQP